MAVARQKWFFQVPDEDRDAIAGILSVVPGLGHLFKRHFLLGLLLMIFGVPIVGFVALLMAPATLGISLILVPTFWILVGLSAVMIDDWH